MIVCPFWKPLEEQNNLGKLLKVVQINPWGVGVWFWVLGGVFLCFLGFFFWGFSSCAGRLQFNPPRLGEKWPGKRYQGRVPRHREGNLSKGGGKSNRTSGKRGLKRKGIVAIGKKLGGGPAPKAALF